MNVYHNRGNGKTSLQRCWGAILMKLLAISLTAIGIMRPAPGWADPVFVFGRENGQGLALTIHDYPYAMSKGARTLIHECWVITAAHIVGGTGSPVRVIDRDGMVARASVWARDDELDIAILRVPEGDLEEACRNFSANLVREVGYWGSRGHVYPECCYEDWISNIASAAGGLDNRLIAIRSELPGDRYIPMTEGALVQQGDSGSSVWTRIRDPRGAEVGGTGGGAVGFPWNGTSHWTGVLVGVKGQQAEVVPAAKALDFLYKSLFPVPALSEIETSPEITITQVSKFPQPASFGDRWRKDYGRPSEFPLFLGALLTTYEFEYRPTKNDSRLDAVSITLRKEGDFGRYRRADNATLPFGPYSYILSFYQPALSMVRAGNAERVGCTEAAPKSPAQVDNLHILMCAIPEGVSQAAVFRLTVPGDPRAVLQVRAYSTN